MCTLPPPSQCKLGSPSALRDLGLAEPCRPSDIYIADLTEILCKKKRLAPPYTDWVLCLADLTLAIPVDRTVASLEGKNDLALVKTQWAVEHGLRIGDRRGGDPSGELSSLRKRNLKANSADIAQHRSSSGRASLIRQLGSDPAWRTLLKLTK